MSITERLINTINEKKIKLTDFASSIGTTPQAINNWKNRNTTPPMEFLPKICETLNISWEYLVTGSETQITYSKEEKELIEQYRKLTTEGQEKLQEHIELLKKVYQTETNKKEK